MVSFWGRRILGMVALGAWLASTAAGIASIVGAEPYGFVVSGAIWLFTLGILIGVPKWEEFDEWKRLKKQAKEWDET